MNLTTVYDCTGGNLGKFPVPAGAQLAGYLTGSGGVPWTAQQRAQHPGAVMFDQSPVNTPADATADAYDLEPNAGTYSGAPGWVTAAWASWRAGTRPGQRQPAVYVEESEVTPAVNVLNAAGITGDVSLWLTKPMTATEAESILQTTSGPFPFIGVQYEFNGLYDVSLVSTAWLENVSRKPPVPNSGPSAQTGWRYCHKCQGLFWGPGQYISHCPAGGQHNDSDSHVYALEIAQ